MTARRIRSGLPVVAVAVLALTAGVLATVGLWPDPAGRMIAANVPDATHYSWWLGHTPHALGQGRSPLFTLDLNWPTGVSAMNNTTLLLPAVLLWPVTAAFGSLSTLNLLNLLAVPACAAAGYWSLRRLPLGGERPVGRGAALAGAAAFAVAPAVVNSLVGHVTMAFAPALPVLMVLSVRAWSGIDQHARPVSPVRTGALLGLVATAQVLVGEEVLFQAGVGATVLLLVAALSRPRAVRAGAGRLGRALGTAFAVFLPLAGYPLHQQFLGPLHQSGSPFLPDYYGADLLSFLVPTDRQWLRSGWSSQVAARFPGGIEEHLAYLGLPLLLLAVLLPVLRRRSVPVRAAVAGLVVAVLLSVGGRIWLNGTWTTVRGPYALLQGLPVTEASLASRFGLLAALFAGAVLALAVHELRQARRGRWGGLLAAGLAAACLLPLLPRPLDVTDAPAVPPYFTGAARALPEDTVMMVLPYPVPRDPRGMRWQSAADYRFRMPGGYFLGPAFNGQAYVGGDLDPATARLLTDVAAAAVAGTAPVPVAPEDRARARQELQALAVDLVVLGPGADPRADAALRSTVTQLLGYDPVAVEGVLVWSDPTVPR